MIMKCPFCDYSGTKVLDSRPVNDNQSIRRRRECEKCTRRFTTFETVEETPLMVVKKDGSREEFSRDKLLRGLIRACEKRPVSVEQLDAIVEAAERELRQTASTEISTAPLSTVTVSMAGVTPKKIGRSTVSERVTINISDGKLKTSDLIITIRIPKAIFLSIL
jgi:transcriptional repressor NrdR